ncbi:hypothetical protein BHM03_00028817 [Ensete ventricosum]|nr:hypothetical protein BHM03_00028817 [Ensete ventricosum]
MELVVEILTGRFFHVEVEEDANVGSLKKAIASKEMFQEQRLVLMLSNGRLLRDDQCALAECGVVDGSIIYLFFTSVGNPNWLTFFEDFVTFFREGDGRVEMSKKKSSFSGSTTMTLKDFHGGSIPSQLPLPSAPSASASASARQPDRPGAWGTITAVASGRSDYHHHLLRPRSGSAGAASSSARGLDERPPALHPHSTTNGGYFDEDERKPFDASSAPRRSPAAPDNTLRTPPPTRSETKRPISSQVGPSPATVPTPVSAFSPPSGSPGSGLTAWGLRKEVGTEPPPPLPTQPKATMWSASRLAQASAVEKVSSGRWQLRPTEGEVIRSQESEGLDRKFGVANRVMDDVYRDREGERPRSVSSIVAYAEANETTLPGYHTDRESDQERARSPVCPEMEKNVVDFSSEGASRPTSSEGRFGGSKLYQQGVMEVLERPKLTLLPRRKLLESPDIQARDFDSKQVY